jgi:hypothetical protein
VSTKDVCAINWPQDQWSQRTHLEITYRCSTVHSCFPLSNSIYSLLQNVITSMIYSIFSIWWRQNHWINYQSFRHLINRLSECRVRDGAVWNLSVELWTESKCRVELSIGGDLYECKTQGSNSPFISCLWPDFFSDRNRWPNQGYDPSYHETGECSEQSYDRKMKRINVVRPSLQSINHLFLADTSSQTSATLNRFSSVSEF